MLEHIPHSVRVALPLALLAAACARRDPPAEDDEPVCRTPADEELKPDFELGDAEACNSDEGGGGGGGPGPTPDDTGTSESGGPMGPPTGPAETSSEGPQGAGPGVCPSPGTFANRFGTAADEVVPPGDVGVLDDNGGMLSLGTNGRQCETCHPSQRQWSITPDVIRERFDTGLPHFTLSPQRYATNESATDNDELEPIFRTVDGTTSPRADVSTPAAREQAYALLLGKALTRVGLPMPEDAEFELVAVDDPYGFASADELSLFRTTPIMANLRFNTTIMWDGRDTLACETLTTSLGAQAEGAIEGHAQGMDPADDAITKIVEAEKRLYVAQYIDAVAGQLDRDGARGGPHWLAQQDFEWGMNAFDADGHDPAVFELFGAWRELPADSETNIARARIAEGERVFASREFTVRGVSGFNDELGRTEVVATCGACHNTPNVGTSSTGSLMDIGVADEANRTADLPLYTFRNLDTGETRSLSDPGRALISKRWRDLGRFKVPSLRGLAVHHPYFHDGSAATLEGAIDYHDRRFAIGLTSDERAALLAFLAAL